MPRMVLPALALVASNTALAASTVQYGPPPVWVHPVSAPAPSDKYGSAPLQVLLNDRQLDLGADGDQEYLESVVRVQNPQGLSAMGTLSLPWNPETSEVTVHKLLILRGGQTIDILKSGQTFTILRRENRLEYATLSGILTAVIQPAGLQVGDVLDFAYTLKQRDPVLQGISQMLEPNWMQTPVDLLHFQARWQTSSDIRWQGNAAFSKLRETHEDGHTLVSLTLHDAQPAVMPKFAPPRYLMGDEVEFSQFRNWRDVSALLAPLYARSETLKADSALHAEIDRIRAASTDPKAQATAALRLVQDQVRYVFLGMNEGGLVPATADETWSRRFGDCKGKTVLLLALLHALGIEATPVAVNTTAGDVVHDRLPMILVFNHVLVRARIAGRDYWLDGTRSGDRELDGIAVPNFHWGLPLTAPGSDLVPLVARPLTQPQAETAVRIDARAGIRSKAPFHVEVLYRGDAATVLIARLSQLAAANLDQALRSYWGSQYSFVTVSSTSATHDDAAHTEKLVMDGTADMDWSSDRYEVDGAGIGYKANLTRDAGTSPDIPYAVAFPTFVRTAETILLPDGGAGFTVKAADVDKTIAGIHYIRHSQVAGGTFSMQTDQISVAQEFPASQAAQAQKDLRELSTQVLYIDAPEKTGPGSSSAPAPAPSSAPAAAQPDPQALLRQAVTDAQNSELDKAESDLTRFISLQGPGLRVLTLRGEIRLQLDRYDDASSDLDAALKLDPVNLQLHAQRNLLYRLTGRQDAAAADAREVMTLRPDDLGSYNYAAGIYAVLGRPEDALKVYENTGNAGRGSNLTLARLSIRNRLDLKGRQQDVDALLQDNPKAAGAVGPEIDVQMLGGDYSGALRTIDTAIQDFGESAILLADRGIAHTKLGQKDLAEQDFSRAHALSTKPNDLNNVCWDKAIWKVDLPRALEECDAALNNGQAPAWLDSKGLVLLQLGRFDEAIAAYDMAIKRFPLHASSLYGRGLAKRHKHDPGAEADLRKALLIDAREAGLYKSYGLEP